eukprot:scaffold51164_cov59-Phaeocystis_antarctica.AAC.3
MTFRVMVLSATAVCSLILWNALRHRAEVAAAFCPAVGNKREPAIGSKGERCQVAALAKGHPDVAERGVRDVDCAEAMRHVCEARVDGEVLR